MSGTINLALSQQFDAQGDPLSGGLLYFFTAGTTTPQTPFQDTSLTIVHPNPIVLDASGRVPMFYVADGFIKIRLTDKNGVVIIAADQLLVIGPSSGGGGGGGGSVDVTTVLATGDIKARYGTGALDGFVRCNGNTIGQTGSSAVELAGPKAQALYEYLWAFPNIVLDSAAKGASAIADFGALKRLILPDLRGRVIAGMDDMGATAINRLTTAGFGTSGIILGNVGGTETIAFAKVNFPTGATLPATGLSWSGTWTQGTTSNATYGFTGNPSGTFFSDNNDWARSVGSTGALSGGVSVATPPVASGSVTIPSFTPTGSIFLIGGMTMSGSVSGSVGGTVSLGGSSTPVKTTQPTMVMTIYIKL